MRKWLKILRNSKNMTQADLANKAGISQQYYSFIENGDRVPSVDKAQSIANILGFQWTRFFEPNQEAS
jgi:transcriptional regulator with XRE-family HTH domain